MCDNVLSYEVAFVLPKLFIFSILLLVIIAFNFNKGPSFINKIFYENILSEIKDFRYILAIFFTVSMAQDIVNITICF